MTKVRYIGLDVHKDSIVVAVAEEGRYEAKRFGTLPYDADALLKTLRRMTEDPAGEPVSLSICYEAGPTGYGLHRRLTDAGYGCQVVAPSLVPTKAGDRVKTDRRDAKKLAHFLRSGDLTPVYVPDAADEALRDLERARDDATRAERRAQQQLGKFLLRHDRRWTGGKSNWTLAHFAWIRKQKFEHAAQQYVLEDYLKAVEDAKERIKELDKKIEKSVHESALAPLITAFQAFRGVALTTAVTLAAETGDFQRFATARQFMAYVGLVPSENSSGDRRQQGKITRAGNKHLRTALVESAWHYIRKPAMSREIRRRNGPVAEGVRKIAWKAQKRLHDRLWRLMQRGKDKKKAAIAVARELAGFLWAAAQEEELLAAP